MSTIGIQPITREDILAEVWNANYHEVNNDSDQAIFKGKEYQTARDDLFFSIIQGELEFRDREIQIKSTRYSHDISRKTLWVKTNKFFAKQVFIRASQIQSKKIRIIPYVPQKAYDRRKSKNNCLKKMREIYPNISYQI